MTRQCPLFHETVLAEWRCVVIQVLFNASYHTVFNVDNLVCLIGNAARGLRPRWSCPFHASLSEFA